MLSIIDPKLRSTNYPCWGDREAPTLAPQQGFSLEAVHENTRLEFTDDRKHSSTPPKRTSSWDTERYLQAGTGICTVLGLALVATRSRKWLFVPVVALGLLAIRGLTGRRENNSVKGQPTRLLPEEFASPEVNTPFRDYAKASATRVFRATPTVLNRAIYEQTATRVRRCRTDGRDAIDRRLEELDQEWDIERVVSTEAPLTGLVALVLGTVFQPMFLLLTGFVGIMLTLHGVHGWYLLLPFHRWLGLRTRPEIEWERQALSKIDGEII